MKTFSLVLLTTLLALLSFNIFLHYSPFYYSVSPVIYDKDIGIWHKKNYANYAAQSCYKNLYTFNKQGLPITTYPYALTKKDIILLGDSFIEAIMIKNKNIIHNSLAKEYHNQYNFLNYGLSATNPIQQYNILKNKVNLKRVHTVLHFINLENDLEGILDRNRGKFSRAKVYMEFKSLDNFTIIPPRQESYIDSITDELGNFQIYFFLKRVLYYIKNNITKKDKTKINLIKKDLTKNWLYLNGSLYQSKKLLETYKIHYKIVIFSSNKQDKAIIKKFLDRESIDFIFLNEIATKMNIKLEPFPCDEHWNNQTHQNIAKILKDINFI